MCLHGMACRYTAHTMSILPGADKGGNNTYSINNNCHTTSRAQAQVG